MKITLTLFISLSLYSEGFCQKLKREKIYSERQEKRFNQCMERKSYSAEMRNKFYPFNIAEKIELVSFTYSIDSGFSSTLPIKANELDFSNIKEHRALSKTQIDTLTNILFNYGYRKKKGTVQGTGCYNPRNAVIFMDANNHLLEFIELCFECDGNRLSSEKMTIGDACSGKYNLIKDFFARVGIKYGTTDTKY